MRSVSYTQKAEVKKAEAVSVLKKLFTSGMGADEILKKLKQPHDYVISMERSNTNG